MTSPFARVEGDYLIIGGDRFPMWKPKGEICDHINSAFHARCAPLVEALEYYTTATCVEDWGMQKDADDGEKARKALEEFRK